MRTITRVLFSALLVWPLLSALAQKPRVLIVSTNRDSVGVNASGTYLKEIAYPFRQFTSEGFDVDIVTPRGGRAAIYLVGNTPDDLSAIQNDELFVGKTLATLQPGQVDPMLYSAVFYPGGHGQYFDVVHDERIARITATIYENGGVVGTAGHGVASLVDVRLSNGDYLVAGKRLTCFPHWAELKWMNISNYGKLLAFDMEEVLARRGALLSVSTFETRSSSEQTLVADSINRLVTGAFASSAQWVAQQMVSLIGQLAEAPSEYQLILSAVADYTEGRNTGDIERLRGSFLPTATLRSVDSVTGNQVVLPVADYISRNKQGQTHQCITEVRLLDYTASTAIVRVVFRYPTYEYHDQLVLLKVQGRWTIADKFFTKIEL